MASAKCADATEPERSNRTDDREGEADFGPKPCNDQQLASNRLHPRPERRRCDSPQKADVEVDHLQADLRAYRCRSPP